MDFLVEMGIPVAAADVVGEGVLDGGESAIMHITSAIGEITERRRFEGAHVGIVLGYGEAADIVQIAVRIGADTQVVELVVGVGRPTALRLRNASSG